MYSSSILIRQKIISLSELQKNPSKALDAAIVRIVKNGKEIGIFMSKEEFEDLIEEHLPLHEEFAKELEKSIKVSKKTQLVPLRTFLNLQNV